MNTVTILKSVGLILLVVAVLYVISLVELYTQLARYQSYWTKNNTTEPMQNEILYVALGDSTAQGIGASSASRGYVGVVAGELSETRDRPVRVINLSKSGAKVADALNSQLPALKKLPINSETIVTIEIGANDMINFEADRFEREMDALMAGLPEQTLITDMPYFAESRFKSKQPNVLVANEIMYRLADKYSFELLPLNARMQSNGGIKTFAPDWFHPSNTAYRENWAHVFLERLK